MDEKTRAWTYRVVGLVLIGLAIAGLITEEDLMFYLTTAGGLFTTGLAWKNTSTKA